MAAYDELAGQPRATADDGLVLILTGQHGDRWHFDFDLPGAGSGVISVGPDPDGMRLHVSTFSVTIPAADRRAEEEHAFRELGAPLQRRLQESFATLFAAWPALSWSGRRCIFHNM